MWAALRVLVALAALAVAYRGEILLEGRVYITHGALYFGVAAIMLIAADLRRTRTPEPAETVRARGSSLAWWGLLAVAFGIGCFYRLHEITSAPWGVWFD